MRRLKLQMQMTVDGCVAGPDGELDWMTFAMDGRLIAFITELADTSDTILLGRKMTPGFIRYWESVVTRPESPEFPFGQKMVGLKKIVFSKTVRQMEGTNVIVENGDLVDALTRLKEQGGKDMIVYGGARFVGSLIEHGLIDELNFFINPVAIGDGMRVFHSRTRLALKRSTSYSNGVVVNTYAPS